MSDKHRSGRRDGVFPWRRWVNTKIEMLTREERRARLDAGELPGPRR